MSRPSPAPSQTAHARPASDPAETAGQARTRKRDRAQRQADDRLVYEVRFDVERWLADDVAQIPDRLPANILALVARFDECR